MRLELSTTAGIGFIGFLTGVLTSGTDLVLQALAGNQNAQTAFKIPGVRERQRPEMERCWERETGEEGQGSDP